MKVSKENTENSQVLLTVEMEPAEAEESLEAAYRRLVKRAKIPGFRQGKAPRAILERYLGRESLLDDVLDHWLPQAYEKAIEEQKIEAIAQPQIEITQTDPLIFKATVPVKPTVKLGDYRSIELTPEPVVVAEDDINSALEQLRHRHATWEPVERPVDSGDLVVLDVEGTVDGKPFVDGKGAQHQVVPDLPFPAPGFSQQLLGMKVDDEKEFGLDLPPDYPRRELAGKEALFKVKVSEVKEERLPEMNDDLASQVDPDLKSLDSLREKVSADLRLAAEERAKSDFEERVLEAVVDQAELEFPPVLVEEEVSRLLDEQSRRWQMGGRGLDEYLASVNKTEEELKEELRPVAVKRVTRSLVVAEIAEGEKVEASDAEIDTEVENLTKDAGEGKDKLKEFLAEPRSRQSISRQLIVRKTLERLVEMASASTRTGNSGGEAI